MPITGTPAATAAARTAALSGRARSSYAHLSPVMSSA
jgi:hypothetical protein